MRYFYSIVSVFFLFFFQLKGQQTTPVQSPGIPGCFTDELLRSKRLSDPTFNARLAIMDVLIRQQSRPANDRDVLTIPVVVHVILQAGLGYISTGQIQQGIVDLNAAFSNSGAYFHPSGVNTGIQFCLARTGPYGEFTTGITYTESELTNVIVETQDDTLKNLIRWDPNQYLNIWLVNEITSASMGSGVAGYANFPTSQGQPEDGIVNEAALFGSSTDNSKVHIHEAGHYLGLYHTFEEACNNSNCQINGDRVCDTPPDNSTAAVICTAEPNSCISDDDDLSINNPFRPVANGGLGDQPDMFRNYMDYGFQVCQLFFSSGQSDRMNAALSTTRSVLLESTKCNTPCSIGTIDVSFSSNTSSIIAGEVGIFTIDFLPTLVLLEWSVNDSIVSTGEQLIYYFETPGVYTISLRGFNSDPSCSTIESITIIVGCSSQATFQLSEGPYYPGINIEATSLSNNALTYEWYLNGNLVNATNTWNQTFNNSGGHSLFLVTGNEQCKDTSNTKFFQVGNCDLSGVTDNWVFVNNAIRFDEDTVSFYNQGSPISDLNTECTSSISDADGNLLFFSDGINIWNRNHIVMPNGSGLMGNPSASQVVIIVPHPGNANQFYVLTNDDYENNLENGLRHSIVDMTLNGGLGDVLPASKNTLLLLGGSEKLTATWHADGRSIWVGTCLYDSNTYLAFLIDNDGIHSEPVVSVIGTANREGLGLITSIGCMKFSHDGNRMATHVVADKIVIADFNKLNGQFSNAIEIPLAPTGADQPFSHEFSPDNSKLYVGQWQGFNIRQFDLSLSTTLMITYSGIEIDPYPFGTFGQLVLGRDGKIYVYHINDNGIDRIASPDMPGVACDYQQDIFPIDIFSNNPGASLPNMLSGYFTAHDPVIAGPLNICEGELPFDYGILLASEEDSTVWSHSGPATLIAQNGTTSATLISGSNPGTDVLMVTVYGRCGITYDTLVIHTNSPEIFELDPITYICDSVLIIPSGNFLSYEWSDGSNGSSLEVDSTGIYWLRVKGNSGCYIVDTTSVIAFPPMAAASLGDDKLICNQQTVVLTIEGNYETYEWQDGSENPTFTAFLPGTYWVTVSNGCAFSTDTLNVIATENTTDLNLNFNGSDIVCATSLPFVLNAPTGYADYGWSNGFNGQAISITSTGLYALIATDSNGCNLRDTLWVNDCLGLINGSGNEIYCFPNPANDKLMLVSIEKIQGITRMYSSSGALVFSAQWNGTSMEITVSEFAEGLYLIRCGGKAIKVLIQH